MANTNHTTTSIYSFSARALNGEEIGFERYRGRPLLIVNTASECGFTPQYKGLQALYQQYAARGLEVLGFPCNQFGGQEPGDAEQIGSFCEKNFGVSFQLFEKIEVNGANTHPLFRFLKAEAPGLLGIDRIKWNFTKFLVDRDGNVVKRFGPPRKPEEMAVDIEKVL
jgi:glutathione peroxidase